MTDSVPEQGSLQDGRPSWWRLAPRDARRAVVTAGVAFLLVLVALVRLVSAGRLGLPGIAALLLGTGGIVFSLWTARQVARLPASRLVPAPATTTTERPDRGWTQFKTVAFMLRGLTGVGVALLLLVPWWGADVRVVAALGALIALLLPLSLLHSLTYDLRRLPDRDPVKRDAVGAGALAGAVATAVAAPVLTALDRQTLLVTPSLLASLVLASVAYHVLLRPPSPREARLDDAVLWPGRPGLTTAHAYGVPMTFAGGFVAFVLLGILVLHAGGAVLTERPLVLLAALLAVAGLTGLSTGLALLRRPDRPDRWKAPSSPTTTTTRLVVGAAAAFGIFLVLGSLLIALGQGPFASTRWIDTLALAVLVGTGPYGFLVAWRARQTRLLEERFPDFLRDLASGRLAGLTLEASVKMATKGDYGALSPEIRRMSSQLAWNLSFEEALARFARRVRTPLVARAVSLITEASRSGGHVAAVLQAAADDARHRKEVQDTRRSHMRVYTGIVYIGFFVFLGVAAVLYATLVPRLVEVSAAMTGTEGPGISGLSVVEGVKVSDYRTFYFVAALAQAIGNGVFAGLVSSGRLFAGLQHVFFMTAATAAIFLAFGAS